MNKIICAGHVTLDIAPVFPDHKGYREVSELLIPGRLIHTEAADVHTGGSVSNTGIALKLLGNGYQHRGISDRCPTGQKPG